MVRYLLDSTPFDTPVKYRDTQIVHKRDEVLRGLMYSFKASVIFYRDAYDYLRTAYEDGACGFVEVDIEEKQFTAATWNALALGRIYLNEVEWDPQRRQCTCKITDRSFNAVIAQSKSVKGYPNVPYSRTKVDISGFIATAFDIELFGSDDGVYDVTGKAYKVYDVLRYLVAYMTDDTVDFDSEAFGVGGDYEFYCVATGVNLRSGTDTPAPFLSFETLVSDLVKLFCLSFYMKEVSGVPTIFIEPEDSTYGDTASTFIQGLYGVTETMANERFYARIEAGSPTTQEADGGAFYYPDIRLLSHKQEEYSTQIGCNLDTTLNLRLQTLITDSNVIDDVVRNGNDEYDDNIFILHYFDDSGTFKAVQSEFVDTGGTVFAYYYNDSLLNERVLNRWTKHIPEGAGLFYDTGDFTCEVEDTGNILTGGVPVTTYNPGQVTYDNELSDPGGAFNNATFFYEIPDNGIYTFRIVQDFVFTGPWASEVIVNLQAIFRRWNTTVTTVLQEVYVTKNVNAPTGVPFKLGSMWATMYCEANEKVGVYIEAGTGPFGFGVRVLPPGIGPFPGQTYDVTNAIFTCTWFAVGGGEVITTPVGDLRLRKHEFRKHITKAKYQDIINDPRQPFTIIFGDQNVPVFIDELSFNPVSGDTEFKTLSTLNISL